MTGPERAEQLYRQLLQQEAARLETRRLELADAEAIIAGLATAEVPLERVSGAQVGPLLRTAVETTTGPIRLAIRSTDTTAGRDDRFVRWLQGQVAGGRVLRTIYPSSFLQDGH